MNRTTQCRRWRLPLAVVCQLLALQTGFSTAFAGQQGLRITIVSGEGARNVAQQIAAKPIIVRVDDGKGNLVEGATVVFTSPDNGPSGEFANDSRTFSVLTGRDGTANAGLYHPNEIQGSYHIQVRAEFQGRNASTIISQTNAAQGKGHKKLLAVIALAGAAAAATIAARSGGSSSSPSTPTITFGGTAVGAPK